MSNLRVKLFLDLVNRLSGPARAARTDLKGVGLAARELRKERGGEQIARDLDRTRQSAARTAREMRHLKQAMREAARASVALGNSEAGARAGSGVRMSGARAAAAGAVAAGGRRAVAPLAAGMGVYGAARGTVGQSVSFEKAMAEVKKKVDLPDGQSFADVERQIVKMAIAFGRSREDVAGIVAEAGAAGVAYNDLAGFTQLATKASIAWDVSAREAAQKLFEIRAATQSTLPELEAFGDKVNALGDTSAAKERDILEMFQRVGAAAKESGVSMDASLAFLTAMRSVGIGEEVGARGFGALVSKMATADESKKVSEGLKMIGLNAKKMAATMKTDATKALLDLFTALEKSKDPVKAAVKMFGQEWFDEMLRTKGSIAEVRKNLATLRDPTKWQRSMVRNLDIELSTTANHLKRMKSLSEEIGDRLGRWALPPINAAIEKIISAMDELDRRAADKKVIAGAGDALAGEGDLGPEARERMIRDGAARREIHQRWQEQVARNVRGAQASGRGLSGSEAAGARALVENLEQQKAGINARILGGKAALHEMPGLSAQIRDIESRVARIRASLPAGDEADMRAGRGAGDHSKVPALTNAINLLESRLRAVTEILPSVSNTADRRAFREEQGKSASQQANLRAELGRKIAPNATAAGNFGFGPGGAPAGTRGGTGIGPGLLSFGIGRDSRQASQAVKSAFDIDLGAAGMTMMERFTSGIRTGQFSAESAAQQVGDGVKNRLAGIDASAAGQQAMTSFAQGIAAGGAQAVAAAQQVAAKVRSALSTGSAGGGPTLASAKGRSLYDGVA